MKKVMIINGLLCMLIGTGSLQANPTVIDVFNLSDKETQFIVTIVPDDGKTPSTYTSFVLPANVLGDPNAPAPTKRYTAKGRNTLQFIRVVGTKQRFDLQQYKDPTSADEESLGIVYTPKYTLMTYEDYEKYKQSKSSTSTLQRAAVAVAALFTYITNTGATLRDRWNKWRQARQPEYHSEAIQQLEVYNALPYGIKVTSILLTKKVQPNETATFFKNTEELTIFQLNDPNQQLGTIDISKYTKHPKENHKLTVTIHEPGWFDRLLQRPIGYTPKWTPDIVGPRQSLGLLGTEQ